MMTPSEILAEARRTGTRRLNFIAEDYSKLMVTLPTQPHDQFSVTTGLVEETIDMLGLHRSAMVPAVPEKWSHGQKVNASRNPAWSIEHDQLAGDPLLHLRCPKFGWRHFILDKDKARALGEALIALADAPAPPIAGRA